MKKICFFVNNDGIEAIDCSNIHLYNPGLGGTPYLFFLLTYYLSIRDSEYEILLLTTKIQKFHHKVKNNIVKDDLDAICFCKNHNVDLLVVRTTDNFEFYDYANKENINMITWSHNFITNYKTLRYLSKFNNIKRNVFVSQEHLDYYLDDKIYSKSTYIFNLFESGNFESNINSVMNKENIITYVGSLTYEKGFHIIARNFKYLKEKVPDLQLFIIGSGNLYNRNKKDNILIPTDTKYKNLILKYLGDYRNEIGKSIHFLGAMGEEKNEILKKTKVGISNPSGKTETFGLTALEFQASGIPVVTKKCVGYLDTVNNNYSGYLFTNESQFVEYVVSLLKDNFLNEWMGKNGVHFSNQKFRINTTCEEWLNLFAQVIENQKVPKDIQVKNIFFKLKFIKLFLRKINEIFNINVSITFLYLFVKNNIKNLIVMMRK